MANPRAVLAELLGSFVLLFGGGLAAFSSGGDLLVISLGFGFALLAALYAFGERSGGHFNPAVSLGWFLDRRIDQQTLIAYIGAQIIGFVLAGVGLWVISSQSAVAGTATYRPSGSFVGVAGAFLVEIVLTAVFVAVILRVTSSEKFGSGALVAIPLTLVFILLAGTRITGASVNPARSLGSALIGNEWSDAGIWLIAPLIGAVVGWLLYRAVHEGADEASEVAEAAN